MKHRLQLFRVQPIQHHRRLVYPTPIRWERGSLSGVIRFACQLFRPPHVARD
jgi:hypothetical protein